MPLSAMAIATLAYAACATNSPSKYTPVEWVRRAERSFGIRVPHGFRICRGDFQVDTINFVVSRGRIPFLNINFSAHPGDTGRGEHIDPTNVTDGRVRRSADGRVETLTVWVRGREHVREIMTRTSERGPAFGEPWYVTVQVSPDLGKDRALLAEKLATEVHVR
jgi:hypothetical protein